MHNIKPITNFNYFNGEWLLRTSNNPNYQVGNTRLQIDNGTICFRTKYSDYVFNEVRKKKGTYNYNSNNMVLNIQFESLSFYKNSLFGIRTPKFNKRSEEYNNCISLDCTLDTYDKLYLYNKDKGYYYLFDLYIEELKIPKIETSLNNYIFVQIFSFLINTLLTLSVRHILLDNI